MQDFQSEAIKFQPNTAGWNIMPEDPQISKSTINQSSKATPSNICHLCLDLNMQLEAVKNKTNLVNYIF